MAIAREKFGSKLGFIFAAAGSAVGIGNLVGFPVNAAKNGGGAFLFVYALFVCLICLPVMLAEISAGRHARRNPIGTFRLLGGNNKFWTFGGWLALITPYMIAVFYAVVTFWLLGYLMGILSGDLKTLANPNSFGAFINGNSIFIFLIATFLVVTLILRGGVQGGIERAATILMPTLLVMLILLTLYVLTRDNAMAGVAYYLTPNFSEINGRVISDAMAQAFFSLSLGMGILITYGSYMESNSNLPFAAKMVAVCDTGVAFFAGLLILPAIFSYNPTVNAEELSSSSVGLVFTYLPQIFLDMQNDIGYLGASVVAATFFTLVLFAAITSLVSIIEVPVSGVIDQAKTDRKTALCVILGSMIVMSGLAALSFGKVEFFTQFTSFAGAPKSFFDVIEIVFYDTILPLNGLLICLLVIYRWKKVNFDASLEDGAPNYKGTLLENYTNFSLSTFIPVILLLVFINTVMIKFFGTSLI